MPLAAVPSMVRLVTVELLPVVLVVLAGGVVVVLFLQANVITKPNAKTDAMVKIFFIRSFLKVKICLTKLKNRGKQKNTDMLNLNEAKEYNKQGLGKTFRTQGQ